MTDPRGLHLHVDCASGAAGDMMLGALIDLGVPVEVIGAALDAIGAGRQRLRIARVTKAGIAAIDLKVDTTGELAGIARDVAPARPAEPVVPHGPRARRVSASGDFLTEEATETAHPSEVAAPIEEPEPRTESTMMLRAEDLEKLRRSAEAAEHRAHPHTRPRSSPPVAMSARDDDPYASVETTAGPGHLRVHHHEPGHGHDHPHAHEHVHGHDHTAHAHYAYADIRRRIVEATLPEGTRRRALDIFDRIARAEATLHGKTVDDVVFHEVGAIDSVVDVVGTAAALDWLAPASVTCTSVAMGHGTLRCAHGVLPVPAPAALEVLREAGGVMADGGVARELCTPTGAAILASTVTAWTAAPPGRPVAIGWGAGDAELADRANVLRVVALAPSAGAAAEAGEVWQVDANLDDMSPELCAPAADAIFAAGALDVWWTPITMKKGRPALGLSVLVTRERRDDVIAAVLRETTTIGVRFAPRERRVLERAHVTVSTAYGEIPIKVARDGDAVLNAAPEYEACAAAARTHGVPVKLVYAAALAVYGGGRG